MFRSFIMGLALLAAACSPPPKGSDILEVNQEIDDQLVEVSQLTGSVRTVVRQFHEGDVDFLGVTEVVVSEQYIHSNPDFTLLVRQSQLDNLPLSVLQQSLEQMWTADGQVRCHSTKTEDLKFSGLKVFLQDHKIKHVVGCPISDPKTGGPIGILSLAFEDTLTPTAVGSAIGHAETTADKIATLLGMKRGTRHQVL